MIAKIEFIIGKNLVKVITTREDVQEARKIFHVRFDMREWWLLPGILGRQLARPLEGKPTQLET